MPVVQQSPAPRLAPPTVQSTLWIGDWGSATLSSVELKEIDRWLILTVAVPNVRASDLEVQIGAETVMLKATQTDRAEVEGYGHFEFGGNQFQSLIPLPCRVYHTPVKADLNEGILTLTLAKLGPIARQAFTFSVE